MLCDDRRPGKGELEEHITALLDTGGRPELYWTPGLLPSFSGCLTPTALFHLGMFRRARSTTTRISLLRLKFWTFGWMLGNKIYSVKLRHLLFGCATTLRFFLWSTGQRSIKPNQASQILDLALPAPLLVVLVFETKSHSSPGWPHAFLLPISVFEVLRLLVCNATSAFPVQSKTQVNIGQHWGLPALVGVQPCSGRLEGSLLSRSSQLRTTQKLAHAKQVF